MIVESQGNRVERAAMQRTQKMILLPGGPGGKGAEDVGKVGGMARVLFLASVTIALIPLSHPHVANEQSILHHCHIT